MKKSQVASLVLLLLLVAVVNQAEAKIERYKRTVKGTLLEGGYPAARLSGSVTCTATATYFDGDGKLYEIELLESDKFKTNSKGKFSVRLVFETNIYDGWKFEVLEGTCAVVINDFEVEKIGFEGKVVTFNPIELH